MSTSLSFSTQSVIPNTTSSNPTSTSDSEIDESAAVDDDLANPHASSSMLAVTGTISVVIVLVVVIVVFFLVRRRWEKRKSSPVAGESLRRSTVRLTRNGVRGSRVRQNGDFGGRQNSLKLSTPSYDSDLPKNDIYELDPRVVVEFGLQDQHWSRQPKGPSVRSTDLPPPYGVR